MFWKERNRWRKFSNMNKNSIGWLKCCPIFSTKKKYICWCVTHKRQNTFHFVQNQQRLFFFLWMIKIISTEIEMHLLKMKMGKVTGNVQRVLYVWFFYFFLENFFLLGIIIKWKFSIWCDMGPNGDVLLRND